MLFKDEVAIRGTVQVYDGIPSMLPDDYVDLMMEANPEHFKGNVISIPLRETPLEERKNLVVDSGKNLLLRRLFLTSETDRLLHIAIGDGAYSFDAQGKPTGTERLPLSSDLNLQNFLVGKNILSVGSLDGGNITGYNIALSTTFTSSDDPIDDADLSTNNLDRRINEIGLCTTESGGTYSNYFSLFTLNNYMFSSGTASMYTFVWILEVLPNG